MRERVSLESVFEGQVTSMMSIFQELAARRSGPLQDRLCAHGRPTVRGVPV